MREPMPPTLAAMNLPQPALVVWLRHVGWTFFPEPFAQLRELDTQFESLGVAVRFVVIGDSEKVSRFCGVAGMGDRCIADPGKASYAQMGFGRYNLLKFFSDRALIARRKENKAAGFTQDWGATRLRDASDLPGAALIDASGALRWVHRASHPGDLPTMAQMLATAAAVLGLPAKE